jgi:hypothetical protein
MTNQIRVPDELWFNLLAHKPCGPGGMETAVRLKDGSIIKNMIISDRGFLLGQEAPGLPGVHGKIDDSQLNFTSDDIAAVLAPKRHFWSKARWVCINPK